MKVVVRPTLGCRATVNSWGYGGTWRHLRKTVPSDVQSNDFLVDTIVEVIRFIVQKCFSCAFVFF